MIDDEGNKMATTAPKRAVILAAGFGPRLRPLTDLRPKPLVEVNGTPILHNAQRNLEAVDVEEVTIVVGYRKDAIEYACGTRFGELEINYVESSVFDHTGSAYSLWLSRDTLLSGDCLLLEGDVYFEEDALRYLMISQAIDVVAVAAVLLSDDDLITNFRMKKNAANLVAKGPRLFKTMNLLRFSASTLRATIVPALDDIIGSGATQTYTEEVLANLVVRHGLRLAAARCDGLRWYEIDSTEDLLLAERIFAGALAFDCVELQNSGGATAKIGPNKWPYKRPSCLRPACSPRSFEHFELLRYGGAVCASHQNISMISWQPPIVPPMLRKWDSVSMFD